jgi:hypothetical protein
VVRGINSFKNWFRGYEEQYVIIGGTACDILMSEENMDFRATKDIDLVLILEAMTPEFGKRFWEYIKNGQYLHCNKSTGIPQFYRFSNPSVSDFPAMIELFTRRSEVIQLPDDATLTPLHVDENISSLSAILLDNDYYSFLCSGKIIIDGVTVLAPSYLIPFKAKAWLDLSKRKSLGEQIDSKNIRKHKNDVFRLTDLINPDIKIQTPKTVIEDIHNFIDMMREENVDLKQLGIVGHDKEAILMELDSIYIDEDESKIAYKE